MTAGVYAAGTHITWHVGSSKTTNVYHKLLSSSFQILVHLPGMSLYPHNVFQDPY